MDRKSVSILIPCYNEEQCLSSLFEAIEPICAHCSEIEWTLLFVNDGSRDATKAMLEHYLWGSKSWCHGKIIDLSRNFGKEAAIIAGLDHCKTDACVIMDADLQDPPELIPKMILKWLEGAQIVSAR
ncbi:MAG: glycosyltransferase, partial [Planctomycetes bacterium]|nr:glycosyltransferase [Planctomycetota bacterium]